MISIDIPLSIRRRLGAVGRFMGIELAPVGHLERIIAALGGFCAIYILISIEVGVIGETGAALLVASMGASAVLLYAVPHGALSQPWAVLVGHVASAIVGVTCAKLVPDPTLAAALAVGLSIGTMYYLRAIHPPGGATALTAVVAGPQVHALGYGFVLTPVLINALIMIALAVAINALFAWRRYPAHLVRQRPGAAPEADAAAHADFIEALTRIGTFMDIDEDDFHRLQDLHSEFAEARRFAPEDIKLGHFYSNGTFGDDWAVRAVIDEGSDAGAQDVIWRCVAGRDRNATGHCLRSDFADWARHEVVRNESSWVRVPDSAA